MRLSKETYSLSSKEGSLDGSTNFKYEGVPSAESQRTEDLERKEECGQCVRG